ncbi:MAG TPA: GNAT family N-acetyltransferase [Solirubrobacteraceae bacterium]|nr:GNAT family N-acetyltransferase [Solirubrobacteraceae bacterium]
MHPILTEMVVRERIADLDRQSRGIILPDGRRVTLRELRREDRGSLADLFSRLSPDSRRNRFLAAKPRITGPELDHLSDVGHPAHRAEAALNESDGSLVGVCRYVADPEHPAVGEVAIAVADDFQNQGIGHALAWRTLARARANGVTLLTATTLRENTKARALLNRFGFRICSASGCDLELCLDVGGGEPPLARPAQDRENRLDGPV